MTLNHMTDHMMGLWPMTDKQVFCQRCFLFCLSSGSFKTNELKAQWHRKGKITWSLWLYIYINIYAWWEAEHGLKRGGLVCFPNIAHPGDMTSQKNTSIHDIYCQVVSLVIRGRMRGISLPPAPLQVLGAPENISPPSYLQRFSQGITPTTLKTEQFLMCFVPVLFFRILMRVWFQGTFSYYYYILLYVIIITTIIISHADQGADFLLCPLTCWHAVRKEFLFFNHKEEEEGKDCISYREEYVLSYETRKPKF